MHFFHEARNRHHIIRSADFPWGLPASELCVADVEKLRGGNGTARAACRIMRSCIRANVPFIMENPSASNIFTLPPMQSIMRAPGVATTTVDMCQFGTLWRKRTALLHFQIDDVNRLQRLCRTRGGICCKSKRPHKQLEGVASTGVHWTRIAQSFP